MTTMPRGADRWRVSPSNLERPGGVTMSINYKFHPELKPVVQTARSDFRGIIALFAGETDTGRTLAAKWISSKIGMPLYRVDLGSITSKYIGETEKNLNLLFDRAANQKVVLLFDEADSLFGNRAEIKASNDRYANTEIGNLLQRLENFPGIVILATNRTADIDKAFLRKIPHVLKFPLPDTK
jgi:SpoVK/Ycf46/Vps4 family AAA+-type ATPase